MTAESEPIPENYVFPAILAIFNFVVLLPMALNSMSYSTDIWDFIFVGIGLYLSYKFVKYTSQAHEYPQTRMNPQDVDEIIDQGIYADVRHPVAAGLLYMNIAYVFLFRSTAIIPVIPMFFALWFVFAKYEERILIERFGDKYREYMQRVGMFRGKGSASQTRLAGTGYEV